MKKFKISIFKKLSLWIIGVVFIPILLMIFLEVLNFSKERDQKLVNETIKEMELTKEKFIESYYDAEAIKLMISQDISFLDFITSNDTYNPLQYIEFKTTTLKNYEKILSLSKELESFRFYVENSNLIEMYPFVKNKIPKEFTSRKEMVFYTISDRPYISYYKEIYFYPRKVYLEMNVNLSEVFKDKENLIFLNGDKVITSGIKKEELPIEVFHSDKVKIKQFSTRNKNYIFMKLPFSDTTVVKVVNKSKIIDLKYLGYLLLVGGFTLAVIYIISYVISRKVFSQLEMIFLAVDKIKKGNLDINFEKNFDHTEFSDLSEQLIIMSKNIKNLISENTENQIRANKYQIKALQSQINSHFLQNTLEGIKMMAYINRDFQVSDSLTNLGKILRYSMDWRNPTVELEGEVEYLKQYIELFSIRVDNSIKFSAFIQDELKSLRIPKMIFQPLIENSIIHGIIPADRDGYIQLVAYKKDSDYIFTIFDNGVGIKESTNNSFFKTGNIGISNVKDRLYLYFGNKVELKIDSKEDCYTTIKIIIKDEVISENSYS